MEETPTRKRRRPYIPLSVSTRSKAKFSVRPQCIETENSICMPELFARYNSRRNYDMLDEKFEEVYRLISEKITQIKDSAMISRTTPVHSPPRTTPVHSPPRTQYIYEPEHISDEPEEMTIDEPINIITLGVFLVSVDENKIGFKKVDWNNLFDEIESTTLDRDTFEELMDIPIFAEYIALYITKIVQDRFQWKEERSGISFYAYIDFYYNRRLSHNSDQFHQDNDNFININYFTLTYILPRDRVILGASLLIPYDTPIGNKGQLKRGNYAALSVAVKNLTTLGIANDKTYHSTPAAISCRKFKSRKNCYIPSTINQTRMGTLEETIVNPETYQEENVRNTNIEIVPLEIETLPHHEMGPVSKVIDDTITTRRTFLRCGFADIKGRPNKWSSVYEFEIDLNQLYQEITTVEVITVDNLFQHVIGGKKTRGKKGGKKMQRKGKTSIIELRKILYNPDMNIILT